MKSRKKVLLYNPKSVFYDMPLALLAIGSELDSSKYEVVVIDGRIEENILEVLKENLDGAICFGVTVLSGYPLNDALEISKKVKELSPETLIILGETPFKISNSKVSMTASVIAPLAAISTVVR